MLRQFVLHCTKSRLLLPQIRSQSTQTNAEKNTWDLLVGVQLERLPIITKTLNKLEQDYQVFMLNQC